MASDRLSELIACLHVVSQDNAGVMSRLSDLIVRFESVLNDLPAKVPAHLDTPDGLRLSFVREGGKWGLRVDPNPSGSGPVYSLTAAPIEIKARAVASFEHLLEVLTQEQLKLKDDVTAVVGTLEALLLEKREK